MPQTRAALLFTLGSYAFRDKSIHLLTQSLGAQPFHGRIVLLVNQWTNSAAEMVANFAAESRLGDQLPAVGPPAMSSERPTFRSVGVIGYVCRSLGGTPRRGTASKEKESRPTLPWNPILISQCRRRSASRQGAGNPRWRQGRSSYAQVGGQSTCRSGFILSYSGRSRRRAI